MEVPISTTQAGSFVYTKGFPADKSIRGVFSFTFYVRSPDDLQSNIYVRGISLYEKAIQRERSVFEGWRIIVYMDRLTHKILTEVDLFVNNPIYECVIVEWPYYDPDPAPGLGQINPDVLRCMRLRAFFDFSTVPVFLRDADTVWADTLASYNKRLTVEPETVYQWEANYLEGASHFPNTLIFSTSLGYQRFWHANELEKRKAPLGAFAGLQSAMPVVPCFQDPDVWNEAMDYILKRSVRSEKKLNKNEEIETYVDGYRRVEVARKNDVVIRYSNELSRIRHGKDEQILLFVFLPRCLDHTFFFEFDMFAQRPSISAFEAYRSPDYPLVIFKRGSNTNLRSLFLNGFKKVNQHVIDEKKMAIYSKNLAEKAKKQAAFDDFVRGTRGLYEFFERDSKFASLGRQSILPRSVYTLSGIGSFKNARVNELFDNYEEIDLRVHRMMVAFQRLFFRNTPLSELEAKREELRALAAERDTVVIEFVKYILSKATKEEILSKLVYPSSTDEMRDFLDNMETILAKKGGKRQTRKRKAQKKKSTRRR